MERKNEPDGEFHPSMKRPRYATKRGAQWFLHNTRPLEVTKQWSAHPSKAAALSAAQEVIDAADASSWLWIEDGELHTSGHARADWGLSIYEGVEAALQSIASMDPDALKLNAAVIGLVEAGKVPEYRALPKRRRAPKPKPVKS